MKTMAEWLVFALGWLAIMALIGIICWAVSKWGAKQQAANQTEEEQPPQE